MNGYKYGAESCTIDPIILTRPQLVLLPAAASGNADGPTKADGNKESKLSNERSSVSFRANPVNCNAFSMPPKRLLKIDSAVLVDSGATVDVLVTAKKLANE